MKENFSFIARNPYRKYCWSWWKDIPWCIWHSIRYAWQRLTKGYDCRMVFSFNGYVLQKIIPDILRELSNGNGYQMLCPNVYDHSDKAESLIYEETEECFCSVCKQTFSEEDLSKGWSNTLTRLADVLGFDPWDYYEESKYCPSVSEETEASEKTKQALIVMANIFECLWD